MIEKLQRPISSPPRYTSSLLAGPYSPDYDIWWRHVRLEVGSLARRQASNGVWTFFLESSLRGILWSPLWTSIAASRRFWMSLWKSFPLLRARTSVGRGWKDCVDATTIVEFWSVMSSMWGPTNHTHHSRKWFLDIVRVFQFPHVRETMQASWSRALNNVFCWGGYWQIDKLSGNNLAVLIRLTVGPVSKVPPRASKAPGLTWWTNQELEIATCIILH